ncbi:hypothetical protein AB0D08_23135 [Kitasatospora sp. NPDC048540]|uniref:hypothetical protein n=1 Tax=unclassified Kitasatospora TaxID=2633591 RepID=UPI000539C88F|nr:hypothetical protein [Kitasatospora sp. MBT63]
MYEYEIIRQRQHQLEQEAERARLVHEARTAREAGEHTGGRTGLRARFARSGRRAAAATGRSATARPARLGEC